jgi:hypothetical protein
VKGLLVILGNAVGVEGSIILPSTVSGDDSNWFNDEVDLFIAKVGNTFTAVKEEVDKEPLDSESLFSEVFLLITDEIWCSSRRVEGTVNDEDFRYILESPGTFGHAYIYMEFGKLRSDGPYGRLDSSI